MNRRILAWSEREGDLGSSRSFSEGRLGCGRPGSLGPGEGAGGAAGAPAAGSAAAGSARFLAAGSAARPAAVGTGVRNVAFVADLRALNVTPHIAQTQSNELIKVIFSRAFGCRPTR